MPQLILSLLTAIVTSLGNQDVIIRKVCGIISPFLRRKLPEVPFPRSMRTASVLRYDWAIKTVMAFYWMVLSIHATTPGEMSELNFWERVIGSAFVV